MGKNAKEIADSSRLHAFIGDSAGEKEVDIGQEPTDWKAKN